MSAKRTPPGEEIAAMAAELRPHLKTGETIVPFIRRNRERLLHLVEEESWATVARVMTELGLTYSSGKPWTAKYISNEFGRSVKTRKRRGGEQSRVPEMHSISAPEGESGQGSRPTHAPPPQKERRPTAPPTNGHSSPTPALPEKRFVFKRTPRLGPPRASTEEELARRQATNDRLFGKK